MFVAPSRPTIQPIGITCNFISNANADERRPKPVRPALMTRTLKDGSRREGWADTQRHVGTVCSTQVGPLGASLRLWSGQWRTPLQRKEESTQFARSQFAREDLLRVIDKILRHLVSSTTRTSPVQDTTTRLVPLPRRPRPPVSAVCSHPDRQAAISRPFCAAHSRAVRS
jgi:hypothetical protein